MDGQLRHDMNWLDLLGLAPFRTLLNATWLATSQAEREPSRPDPRPSALRQRFNREVIFLANRLHTLRPTLVLPPLRLLASVLASDVADSKQLTGVVSGLGVCASYSWTLPLRVEAEAQAFDTRLLWMCVGFFSGGRWILGFDNVNKLRRFLNGGCLDMIGCAAFFQRQPLEATRSRQLPELHSIDDSIFELNPSLRTA
eukprot:2026115-Prymnesium_polylepis.1